ncbi:MAG: tRNA lysidine(34) synthetase TilS [Clostridia bacterium]|nr:tRNA lysidine(34) synthetase TilS [Clostridia bacterium]
MKLELAAYAGKKICVAVSGGRDSMALLHYLNANKDKYGIRLSALNCDHGMRANSSDDSAFVKNWCKEHGIPLICFKAEGLALKTEAEAREWRRSCYFSAVKGLRCNSENELCGADFVATAHHLNDNAETVLFNLARGSALAGITGITDTVITNSEGEKLNLIHPLISVTREEINSYIKANGVPFVDDETNFSDAYTRNYIRNNVLPALEKAVPDATKAFFRFSRLAAEDEEFFRAETNRRGILSFNGKTAYIKTCEKPLFSRASVTAIRDYFKKKDYTTLHIDSLFSLADNSNGKKFEFLGLTAYKEEGGISICLANSYEEVEEVPFFDYLCGNSSIYGGQFLKIAEKCSKKVDLTDAKILKFDLDVIPKTAAIRFAKSGDKFTKFGGGTKSLGDFFTDRKIPVRLRKSIPVIADGNDILAVCGVEISDKIKVTDLTRKVGFVISRKIYDE